MNGSEKLFYSDGENGYSYYKYIDDSVLYVYERDNIQVIQWNNKGYHIVENGINIFIYDEALQEIVGKIAYDADHNYELIRWR